jgi:hypothetical protein
LVVDERGVLVDLLRLVYWLITIDTSKLAANKTNKTTHTPNDSEMSTKRS